VSDDVNLQFVVCLNCGATYSKENDICPICTEVKHGNEIER
jgi:RNA polymerase subunit RPABC4/transcription elongation factor Spt4